jgi:multidrug efflux pump subunit AcrB
MDALQTDPVAGRTSAGADYERAAGAAAILAGIGAVVYSIAFLGGVVGEYAVELGTMVAAIALLVGGLLSVMVLVVLYRRLLDAAPAVALLGLALVAIGAAGTIVHGGYDLANAINPPTSDVLGDAGVPHPMDPRGLLTFGMSGLGLFVLTWQSRRSGTLPSNLATVGMLVGILLIVIYLGRLIILTPTNPLVAIPAAATGFLLSPAFYIWLGLELRRR